MVKTLEPSAKETITTPVDDIYTAADLALAARERFGAAPELVSAALGAAGIRSASLSEAERTIANFIRQEVN